MNWYKIVSAQAEENKPAGFGPPTIYDMSETINSPKILDLRNPSQDDSVARENMYDVPEWKMGWLNEKINKLNKVCKKLNITPIQLEIIGESTKELEDKKVIVWYTYGNEKVIIEQLFKDNGFKYVDYAALGHLAVSKFNDKKAKESIFLSQIQSSSGITLNAACYTIYYSQTFDLEHYLQSRDRNYRKGQTEKVVEYQLIMRNSLDEHIQEALDNKEDVIEALLKQNLHRDKIVTKINK